MVDSRDQEGEKYKGSMDHGGMIDDEQAVSQRNKINICSIFYMIKGSIINLLLSCSWSIFLKEHQAIPRRYLSSSRISDLRMVHYERYFQIYFNTTCNVLNWNQYYNNNLISTFIAHITIFHHTLYLLGETYSSPNRYNFSCYRSWITTLGTQPWNNFQLRSFTEMYWITV